VKMGERSKAMRGCGVSTCRYRLYGCGLAAFALASGDQMAAEIAVLDDYQGCALKMADWSKVTAPRSS